MRAKKKESNLKFEMPKSSYKIGSQKQFNEMRDLLSYPEVQSWRAIMEAFTTIFSRLEKGLMAEGCTVSRFQVLFHLYFKGDLAATELANILFLTRGNISMLLKRMVADELIEQVFLKGQKRPVYCLTKKGLKLFEEIFPPHIERVRNLAPVLDAPALKKLHSSQKKA